MWHVRALRTGPKPQTLSTPLTPVNCLICIILSFSQMSPVNFPKMSPVNFHKIQPLTFPRCHPLLTLSRCHPLAFPDVTRESVEPSCLFPLPWFFILLSFHPGRYRYFSNPPVWRALVDGGALVKRTGSGSPVKDKQVEVGSHTNLFA